jgi:PKHD-type hydroxylase
MVICSASSLHHAQPVTRAMRLAAIFSIQSLVRNNDDRQIPLDPGTLIQRTRDVNPGDPSILSITDIYQNLRSPHTRRLGAGQGGKGRPASSRNPPKLKAR